MLLFCERAWVDYPFETCIGLPTYIVPLVNPHSVPMPDAVARSNVRSYLPATNND